MIKVLKKKVHNRENGVVESGKVKDLVDFLPGIELKTDKGKSGVHLIAIFPKWINIRGTYKKADKKTLYDKEGIWR